MKNLNQKQIAQVQTIHTWTNTRFHGNTKKVGSLSVNEIKNIVEKKVSRQYAKIDTSEKTNLQVIRQLINQSKSSYNTNYFKILIEGNTGIYYASPNYQHSDYNKSRVFDKNEKTLKLMKLFNKIVNK